MPISNLLTHSTFVSVRVCKLISVTRSSTGGPIIVFYRSGKASKTLLKIVKQQWKVVPTREDNIANRKVD